MLAGSPYRYGVKMEITSTLASDLSAEFAKILGSDAIVIEHIQAESDLTGPNLLVKVSARDSFLLSHNGDEWFSDDSLVSVLLEEHNWAQAHNVKELVITISGIALWWIHTNESSTIPSTDSYLNQILTPIVRHWNQVYSNLGLNYELGKRSFEVASFWNDRAKTYGFAVGLETESKLSEAVNPIPAVSFWAVEDEEIEDTSSTAMTGETGVLVLSRTGSPVSRSEYPLNWRFFRRNGVTATDALKLLRKNGKPSRQRVGLLRTKVVGDAPAFFESYSQGLEREPIIASWLTGELPGSEANDCLFQGQNRRHLATPDMVGDGYVVEIKVSNKPLEQIVVKYNDQVQWQMHVMGAERALVALEDRESQEISSQWIERDDDRIAALSGAADQFLESLDQANSIWDSDIDIDDWDAFFIEPQLDIDYRSSRNLLGPLEPYENPHQLLDNAYVSSAFLPAGASTGTGTGKRVIFRDIAEDDAEQESSKASDEGENFAAGNPFRAIRLRLGVSQADFRSKFDFGKMTMVYLENGMYTGISARQEDAIRKLAEEKYFDLSAFLRREYETENLNDAYKKWQSISRREVAGEKVEKIRPPFPFTFEHSPLFFIITQHFGSIQRFCKIMKIPSVTITRHLDGKTLAIPSVLIEAMKDAGHTHLDAVLLAQNSWVARFRAKNKQNAR